MTRQNQFLIRNDLAGLLTLNIEPEGAFLPLGRGEEVSVTDQFQAVPVTVTVSSSMTGSPVISIWPGDGDIKVEKDGIDVLDLIQRDSALDRPGRTATPGVAPER